MSKRPCQPPCECRGCICTSCPNVLDAAKESGSSDYICDHGTRPKCTCNADKPKEGAAKCIPDCCFEPEPIPDPERTRSFMKVLKYDKSCFCKVVTRALRADVHRYLGMLDRYQNTEKMGGDDTQTSCCNSDA
ncbi:uncharacterized protein LOC133522950 [Cydia pomonella]|uniref:uncharacterized protein LOC133522950 n=1 Tax=Cydia pomonella TaxID=82600 RepID=UPI002ADD6CF8|nr:uncharacterized protein LOC133522950 [Cydia pomonella]